MFISNHRKDYTVSIRIKKGKIISIEAPVGGDLHRFGIIWDAGWALYPYGSKLRCMRDVARLSPHVYEKVRSLCPKEKLEPLKVVQIELRLRALENINKTMERLKKKLNCYAAKRTKVLIKIYETLVD